MSDEPYRRYVRINLPHSRTIVSRLGRSLEALGAFGEAGNGGAFALRSTFEALDQAVQDFDEDPPMDESLRVADDVAALARRRQGAFRGDIAEG